MHCTHNNVYQKQSNNKGQGTVERGMSLGLTLPKLFFSLTNYKARWEVCQLAKVDSCWLCLWCNSAGWQSKGIISQHMAASPNTFNTSILHQSGINSGYFWYLYWFNCTCLFIIRTSAPPLTRHTDVFVVSKLSSKFIVSRPWITETMQCSCKIFVCLSID